MEESRQPNILAALAMQVQTTPRTTHCQLLIPTDTASQIMKVFHQINKAISNWNKRLPMSISTTTMSLNFTKLTVEPHSLATAKKEVMSISKSLQKEACKAAKSANLDYVIQDLIKCVLCVQFPTNL